mmetsp:Transcript_142993/g.456902  ORF Transcript_142993/g.456902 Transcript_142993/m.456902 type:complete len:142 (+) Transcript_142993:899-1324(+)
MLSPSCWLWSSTCWVLTGAMLTLTCCTMNSLRSLHLAMARACAWAKCEGSCPTNTHRAILLLRWAKEAAQMKQDGGKMMSFLQAVLYASTELEKDENRQLYAIGCLDLSIGIRREGIRDLVVLPCMGRLASASTAESTDPR